LRKQANWVGAVVFARKKKLLGVACTDTDWDWLKEWLLSMVEAQSQSMD
jgi:hypothetical protein